MKKYMNMLKGFESFKIWEISKIGIIKTKENYNRNSYKE
jgi:hypothetical protein